MESIKIVLVGCILALSARVTVAQKIASGVQEEKPSNRAEVVIQGRDIFVAMRKKLVHLYPYDGMHYTGFGWWRVYVPEDVHRASEMASFFGREASWKENPLMDREFWIVRVSPKENLRAQKVQNYNQVNGVTEAVPEKFPIGYFKNKLYGILLLGAPQPVFTGEDITRKLLQNRELRKQVDELKARIPPPEIF